MRNVDLARAARELVEAVQRHADLVLTTPDQDPG